MYDAPNCYLCVYRGTIPGDEHSTCNHPGSGFDADNPISSLFMLLGKRMGPVPIPETELIHITGYQHGIDNSLFNWPFNFDPIWLTSCDGFKQKESKNDS
jgi:hypothetical protein